MTLALETPGVYISMQFGLNAGKMIMVTGTGQVKKIRVENTQTPKRQQQGKAPHSEVALFSKTDWIGSLRVRSDRTLWSRKNLAHEIKDLLCLGLQARMEQKRAAKRFARKSHKTSPKSDSIPDRERLAEHRPASVESEDLLLPLIREGDIWLRRIPDKKNFRKNSVIVTDVTEDTVQYQAHGFRSRVKSRKAFIAKFMPFTEIRHETPTGNPAIAYRKAGKSRIKGPIFLSSSMPDPKHDYGYARMANSTAITAATRALVIAVLGCRHLILENHPFTMTLVTQLAKDMNVDCNAWVTVVEHEFLHKESNDQFTNGIHEPRRIMIKGTTGDARETREQARTRMVREMFSIFDFDGAVFIGGAGDVFEEFDLFRKLNPHAAIIPVLSTGGATALLANRFESLPGNLESNPDYHELFHDHLGISRASG